MSAFLYLEGGSTGPNSKELNIRCRAGFGKLLARCGFEGRMPRLSACGGRASVFRDFSIAHASKRAGDYVAMWIDSEEEMTDTGKAWEHLQKVTTVPKWQRPVGATDDQVLFMTTCMETWIVADQATLAEHYGHDLQANALPPLVDLEQRPRHTIQSQLVHATRNCTNVYKKGKQAFDLLGNLSPNTLQLYLPSFARARTTLNTRL